MSVFGSGGEKSHTYTSISGESESFYWVYDEREQRIGCWLSSPQNIDDKLPVLLSMAGLPMPSSYRVVSNYCDDRGGCYVMFGSARAPLEPAEQFAKSMAAEDQFQKGVLAAQRGDVKGALKYFDQAIAGRPFSPEAWNNKAFALASLNRDEEAIECCDKAIELNPRYADPHDVKGRCLGRLGRYREAVPVIEKYIELAPPEHEPRVQQAQRAVNSLRRRLGL